MGPGTADVEMKKQVKHKHKIEFGLIIYKILCTYYECMH